MTTEIMNASRETTTTKPDRTDKELLVLQEEKTIGTSIANAAQVYSELNEWISARMKYTEIKEDVDRTLREINDEINTRVDIIFRENLVDKTYVLTGVRQQKRRTINPAWFRENKRDIFDRLAIVDGKTAIRLVAKETGSLDAARKFLRDIDPETYDNNASFTLADLKKICGYDVLDSFEVAGGFKVVTSYVGDAQLVPIRVEGE